MLLFIVLAAVQHVTYTAASCGNYDSSELRVWKVILYLSVWLESRKPVSKITVRGWIWNLRAQGDPQFRLTRLCCRCMRIKNGKRLSRSEKTWLHDLKTGAWGGVQSTQRIGIKEGAVKGEEEGTMAESAIRLGMKADFTALILVLLLRT